MGAQSKIEWTDATWNPIRARNRETGKVGWFCVHASGGCINCYAEGFNHRLGTGIDYKAQNAGLVEIFLDEKMLTEPLRWRKPCKIFVGSMTDLFGEFVHDEMIDRMFAVMALCPQHTFQVLTKCAERMREYFCDERRARIKLAIERVVNNLSGDTTDFAVFHSLGWKPRLEACKPDCTPPCKLVWIDNGTRTIRAKDYDGEAQGGGECRGEIRWDGDLSWPLPNVWLGISCEDQANADARIPHLLATPAAVRFLSCEPLLGPIDLTEAVHVIAGEMWNYLTGWHGKSIGADESGQAMFLGPGDEGSVTLENPNR